MAPDEVAAEVNLHAPRRPGAARGAMPQDLEEVVMQLLAREPRARYQAASEAIDGLARCAEAPRDGARDLARLVAVRTAPESANERGRREMWLAPPARQVPPRILLDVPRREPRDYSSDEYLALLNALQRFPPWNRSRDKALAHVLYRCRFTVATAVELDIGQLHLGRRTFLGVKLPGSSEQLLNVPLTTRSATLSINMSRTGGRVSARTARTRCSYGTRERGCRRKSRAGS
jgi:site-specific recombinase XerC